MGRAEASGFPHCSWSRARYAAQRRKKEKFCFRNTQGGKKQRERKSGLRLKGKSETKKGLKREEEEGKEEEEEEDRKNTNNACMCVRSGAGTERTATMRRRGRFGS